MKKTIRKTLALILSVMMIVSCMVFSLPSASAATFPQTLYNGTDAIDYSADDASEGKYLVEVDVVKFSPNYMVAPAAIKSEAGDIIITYKPSNGLDAEKTLTLDDVIPANTFNFDGEGQRAYYAVVDGFPSKATASIKKTNTAANDSGIFTGIKIWDCTIGTFNNIYDFTKVDRQNGAETASLMFSNIEVLNQYYPYAKNGSASGGSLTLPENITNPKTSTINFAVTDQWGVTMVSPKIVAPSVAGLTFSQNNNIVTVKGTGDANYYSSSNNYRDVTVKATYSTANENATGITEVPQVCRITNSSTKTYAPTYDNRNEAGLSLWFTAGSTDNPKKLVLNSSYQMTTTNYLKIKNNSTRTATIKSISTPNSTNFKFVFDDNTTLAAGATLSVKIQDLQAASENYSIDADVSYTLEGLFNASTGSLVTLSSGLTVPCIYNNNNSNTTVRCEQIGGATSNVVVDVSLYGGSKVLFDQKSFGKKSGTSDEFEWTADCYIDTTTAKVTDTPLRYESDGIKMGFHFINQYGDRDNQYYFQKQENNSGTHRQADFYDSIGSFGFRANPSGHTDGKKEDTGVDIGKGKGKNADQPFYGEVFGGYTGSTAPAQIIFSKLQLFTNSGLFNNSVYYDLTLNVYAINKTLLNSSVTTARSISPLSCYYSTSSYNAFSQMSSSSKLKTALIQYGKDMTNQFDVKNAQTGLDTAYTNLIENGKKGGTYCVVHQKHSGDINTPITETAVDYFVFDVGASNNLKFKSAYTDVCNKHSATYTASVASSGSYTHVYDYWNIDFSNLEAVMDEYVAVTDQYDFCNTEEAVGNQLTVANAVDTTSTTPLPADQNDVEVVAMELKNAMRNLVFTSFEMSVTHKMVSPTGEEITDEEYAQFTEHPNVTTTYGEFLDGTADINDSTYTIKGVHYAPTPNAKFLDKASKYRTSGISSGYVVKESKNITFTYTAKPIEDTELSSEIADFNANAEQWRAEFTKTSFEGFLAWFEQNEETITQAFCVFDEEAYDQILELFREEKDKLDPIITDDQIAALEEFNEEYEMLQMMPQAYCDGEYLERTFKNTYDASQAILELVDENDAGKNAAQEILDVANTFTPTIHTTGEKILINSPVDGIAGSYAVMCANCSKRITAKHLPNPVFNTAVSSYYDYSNRGASLCYSEDEATSPDTQHMRFPASCVVPDGATIEDFGFVSIPTMYLNGGAEPDDNTPVNIGELQIGKPHVDKVSVYNSEDPHYTVHPQADGSSVYTFNLKMNINKAHWGMHYAVRGYVTYNYDGVSVTVYDKSYSSRSADYIAKCVMENPNELEVAKQVIGTKFGYDYK